jgi:hypothetical protein
MTYQFTFFPSFHNSNTVLSDGSYNLWSYTLCCFLQYPITFSHKSLRPDQHHFQTQTSAFPQCHRSSVTPTFMKIIQKHTHIYISIVLLSDSRKESIAPNSFPLISSSSQLYCLMTLHNISSSPTPPKFKTMHQTGHVFSRCDIPTLPLQYIIRK